MIEIHKRIPGPQALAQGVARDQLARLAQQDRQHLKGLSHQLDPGAEFPQLMGMQVGLKRTELNPI